jgi:hypothetical protein
MGDIASALYALMGRLPAGLRLPVGLGGDRGPRPTAPPAPPPRRNPVTQPPFRTTAIFAAEYVNTESPPSNTRGRIFRAQTRVAAAPRATSQRALPRSRIVSSPSTAGTLRSHRSVSLGQPNSFTSNVTRSGGGFVHASSPGVSSPLGPSSARSALSSSDCLVSLKHARNISLTTRGMAMDGATRSTHLTLPFVPYPALVDIDRALAIHNEALQKGGAPAYRETGGRDAAWRFHARGGVIVVDDQGGVRTAPQRSVLYAPSDAVLGSDSSDRSEDFAAALEFAEFGGSASDRSPEGSPMSSPMDTISPNDHATTSPRPPPRHSLSLSHIYGFSPEPLAGSPNVAVLQNCALRRTPGVPEAVYAVGGVAVVIGLGTYQDVMGARAPSILATAEAAPGSARDFDGADSSKNGETITSTDGDADGGAHHHKVSSPSSPFVSTNPMWAAAAAAANVPLIAASPSALASPGSVVAEDGDINANNKGGSVMASRTQRLYTSHTAAITSLATHPTLPLVATAQLPSAPLRAGDVVDNEGGSSADYAGTCASIRLWHTGTLRDIAPSLIVPEPAGRIISSLSFSPCGRYLLAVVVSVIPTQNFARPSSPVSVPVTEGPRYSVIVWSLDSLSGPDSASGGGGGGGGGGAFSSAATIGFSLFLPVAGTSLHVHSLLVDAALLGLPEGASISGVVSALRPGVDGVDEMRSIVNADAHEREWTAGRLLPDWLLQTTAGVIALRLVGAETGSRDALALLPLSPFLSLPNGAHVTACASVLIGGSTERPGGFVTALALSSGSLCVALSNTVVAKVDFDPPSPISSVTAVMHQRVAGLPTPLSALFIISRADGSLAVVQCRHAPPGEDDDGPLIASPVLTSDLGRIASVVSGTLIPVPEVDAAAAATTSDNTMQQRSTATLAALALVIVAGTSDGALLRGTVELRCTSDGTITSVPSHNIGLELPRSPLNTIAGPEDLVLEVLEQSPRSGAAAMATHPLLPIFAVGLLDGTIQVWDSRRHCLLGELHLPDAIAVAARGRAATLVPTPSKSSTTKRFVSGDESFHRSRVSIVRRVTALDFSSDGVKLLVALASADADISHTASESGGGGGTDEAAHVAAARHPSLAAICLTLPEAWLARCAAEAHAAAAENVVTYRTALLVQRSVSAYRSAHPSSSTISSAQGRYIPEVPMDASTPILSFLHCTPLPLGTGSGASAAIAAHVAGMSRSTPRAQQRQNRSDGASANDVLIACLTAPVTITALRIAPANTPPGGLVNNTHRKPQHERIVVLCTEDFLKIFGEGGNNLLPRPVMTPVKGGGKIFSPSNVATVKNDFLESTLTTVHPDDLVITVALGTSGGTVEIITVDPTAPPTTTAASTPGRSSMSGFRNSAGGNAGVTGSHASGSGLALWRRKTLRIPTPPLKPLLTAVGPTAAALLVAVSVPRLDWDATGRYLQAATSSYELVQFDVAGTGLPSRSTASMRDIAWATQSSPMGWAVAGAHRASSYGVPPAARASAPLILSGGKEYAKGAAAIAAAASAATAANRRRAGLNKPSYGSEAPVEDVVQLLSVARNRGAGISVLATGCSDGAVRLFRYPACTPNASARLYRSPHAFSGVSGSVLGTSGGGVGVIDVAFTVHDESLVSLSALAHISPIGRDGDSGSGKLASGRGRTIQRASPWRTTGEAAARELPAPCAIAVWEFCEYDAKADALRRLARARAFASNNNAMLAGPLSSPSQLTTPGSSLDVLHPDGPTVPPLLFTAPVTAATLLKRYEAASSAALSTVAATGYVGPARVRLTAGATSRMRVMDTGVLVASVAQSQSEVLTAAELIAHTFDGILNGGDNNTHTPTVDTTTTLKPTIDTHTTIKDEARSRTLSVVAAEVHRAIIIASTTPTNILSPLTPVTKAPLSSEYYSPDSSLDSPVKELQRPRTMSSVASNGYDADMNYARLSAVAAASAKAIAVISHEEVALESRQQTLAIYASVAASGVKRAVRSNSGSSGVATASPRSRTPVVTGAPVTAPPPKRKESGQIELLPPPALPTPIAPSLSPSTVVRMPSREPSRSTTPNITVPTPIIGSGNHHLSVVESNISFDDDDEDEQIPAATPNPLLSNALSPVSSSVVSATTAVVIPTSVSAEDEESDFDDDAELPL